jgi:hypothetical protein
MMEEFDTGAVVGTPEGPARRVSEAFDTLLAELGYTLVPDAAYDDLVRYTVDEGGWVTIRTPTSIARALAHRLAARVGRTVHLFTATARYEDPLECAVEDLRIRPDGRATSGPVGREFETLYGDDWGSICDGKGHFLMSSVLDAALGEWADYLGNDVHFRLVPPASLGDPRLDRLALQVRMSVRAEAAVAEGRRCVRVSLPDETVVTTFVNDDWLDTLRSAVGPLLE